VDRIQPFDLVILLALLAMFIVGYAQGVVRRLLGIGAIIFALILGAQLRDPLGAYLANQWQGIAPSYSLMVAFGAVFFATAVTLSLGIQLTYRPAPLFPKYPVLDEILGGILGVIEGLIILAALFMILDPHYNSPQAGENAAVGEFALLRTLHGFLDQTLTAELMRGSLIPGILAVFGFLFAEDIRQTFARVRSLVARA
jgi:uncharacterized membrane protein required for colicin V production